MNWQDTFVRLVKAALPKAEIEFPTDVGDKRIAIVRAGAPWRVTHVRDESLSSLMDTAVETVSYLMCVLMHGERCKIAMEERRSGVATGTEVKP